MKTWNGADGEEGVLLDPLGLLDVKAVRLDVVESEGSSVTVGGWLSQEDAAAGAARDKAWQERSAAYKEAWRLVAEDHLWAIRDMAREARALTIDPAAAAALEKIETAAQGALFPYRDLRAHERLERLRSMADDRENARYVGISLSDGQGQKR